jgi:uncharacterized Zn finger protein
MTNYQVEKKEWWVERWLELLDSYRFKKRLERARMYAREGNVLKIEFKQSQVIADVQGTEIEPYQVILSLEPFSKEDWSYVIATMAEKAIFSAQLLAGEMPENIEQVFISNGLSLFPFSLSDIRSRCSCPDQANPCKHIGAVYYQLGDRLSEDPFVLFQLRGRTKEQILEDLRVCRASSLTGNDLNLELYKKQKRKTKISKTKLKQSTPLKMENFWEYNQPLDPSLVVITPSTEEKTVLDVLGNISLPYADREAMMQYLKQVYHTVPQKATMLALNQN